MLNINKSQIPDVNYTKNILQKQHNYLIYLIEIKKKLRLFSISLWLLEFLELLWLSTQYQNSQTEKMLLHTSKNPV